MAALVYFEGGDLQSVPDNSRRLLVEAVRSVYPLPPVRTLAQSLARPADITE